MTGLSLTAPQSGQRLLVGRQNRPATRTNRGRRLGRFLAAAELALAQSLEPIDQPVRLRRSADRIPPLAKQALRSPQIQGADAGLLLRAEARDRRQRPIVERQSRRRTPAGSLRQLPRPHGDQPPVGQNQQSAGVVQTGVQVQFEPNQRRLARGQLGLDHAAQIGRELFPRVVGGGQVIPRRE